MFLQLLHPYPGQANWISCKGLLQKIKYLKSVFGWQQHWNSSKWRPYHSKITWTNTHCTLFFSFLLMVLVVFLLILDSHDSGKPQAITTKKLSFRTPWRVGDTVVSRENAGWTTLKNGHSWPCKNCSQWPPAVMSGRRSLLNCLSSHWWLNRQGTELTDGNYTQEHCFCLKTGFPPKRVCHEKVLVY